MTAQDAIAPRVGATPVVLLRLLGPVRLEVDGVDRTPLGPLLRGLLATLGCARGEAVPVETLAAVLAQLGGEGADAEPAQQVQVHLARLADVLGPASSYLTQTAAGVRLRGPGVRSDLDAVEDSVTAGRAAAAAGDGAGAATALRRALARWPGPVADDLPGLPALAGVRARYARLRPDVVEDLAASELRDGSTPAAQVSVRELEAHVAEHPGRARGWGLLVEALHLAGRPVEALQAVRRATTAGPGHDRDEVLRPVERAALRRSRLPAGRPGGLPDGVRNESRRPSLVWVDAGGRALSRALPATGSVLIGRDAGADVPLGDPSVSRTHAAVLRWENGWTLLDLGSRDGTTLDGRPVTDGTPLHPGDVVRCGDVVLLVADGDAGGVPEDARESTGAPDLRDATALAEPLVVPLVVQLDVQIDRQISQERRPVL
ncbi:MAG: BTAD domain-containing putative transcriptional regulator [Kineosporiaceae bacterium]